jgi:hypothetical protein
MQQSILFHYTLTLGLLALLFTATCIQPPNYPKEPVIAFKSLSKTTMQQTALNRNDNIEITFTFTDGDGDLGLNDSTFNVFVRDGEDGFSRSSFRIPYIEQQGAGNGISGEITLIAGTTCCKEIDQDSSVLTCREVKSRFDTVFYVISIKDRAGNRSNEIKTAPIRLICKQ